MRLLLGIALVLLFLWLREAQTSGGTEHGNAFESVSMSQAAVSLLLSPLSLYSWLASTLLRFILSAPALVLSSLHTSLLLLLALPWCVASVCISLLLTCLQVVVYLLHLTLVVAAVAILTLTQHKVADGGTSDQKVPHQQKKPAERRTKTTKTQLMMFGGRVAQQG